MSEQWIFLPCQMGDHRAFIFYDHGIRDSIKEVAPPNLLKLRVAFKQPGPDGMPPHDEFEQLTALEDGLQALAQAHASVYVGRVTVAGHRHFYIYTPDADEAAWSARLDSLGEQHRYQLAFSLKSDVSHDGYWQELFPTEDDWQVVQDLGVLEALKKEGDDGSASRQIDHWAYFPSLATAEQFSQWVEQQGYAAKGADAAADGKFRVCFTHEGKAQWPDISSHTIRLRRMASELGGEYDGWETMVHKVSG
jgi:hypothetical protein